MTIPTRTEAVAITTAKRNTIKDKMLADIETLILSATNNGAYFIEYHFTDLINIRNDLRVAVESKGYTVLVSENNPIDKRFTFNISWTVA